MPVSSAIPIWLFLGPEIGNKNTEIEQILKNAKKQCGELDEHSFYANETSVSSVLSILQSGSLFSAGCFVIYKIAESIKKKEDIELISEWVSSVEKKLANENTSFLVLVSDEISVDKKLTGCVPKQNQKVFWELFENQKNDWIRKYFTTNGFRIESDAIDSILELVENDTQTLKSECSRFLLCFDKGHEITSDDVDTVLTHNREETPFTLFSCMCEKDLIPAERLSASLTVLQHIRNSKDSSYVSLIAALTHCFRKLITWHTLIEENPYPNDFDLKIKGFSSKKMQAQYSTASKIWTKKETVLCLSLLAQTDMNIRTTGTQIEEIALQKLLYALVIKKGRELNVYSI